MDRMTDSGSVGWAFESPRDHKNPDFFRVGVLRRGQGLESRIGHFIGHSNLINGGAKVNFFFNLKIKKFP